MALACRQLEQRVDGIIKELPGLVAEGVRIAGMLPKGLDESSLKVRQLGHVVLVEYNGVAVGGTPFYSKAYDSEGVVVEGMAKGVVGKTVTFAGKTQNVATSS